MVLDTLIKWHMPASITWFAGSENQPVGVTRKDIESSDAGESKTVRLNQFSALQGESTGQVRASRIRLVVNPSYNCS